MLMSSTTPLVKFFFSRIDNILDVWQVYINIVFSQYLETGCPNRGFIDLRVPKCGTQYILLI